MNDCLQDDVTPFFVGGSKDNPTSVVEISAGRISQGMKKCLCSKSKGHLIDN